MIAKNGLNTYNIIDGKKLNLKEFFMQKERLQKYAELLVKCGINVQNGQDVIIHCGLDQPDFVAAVVEECYKNGADRVRVDWSYMPVSKLNLNYRSLETLSEFTALEKAEYDMRLNKQTCILWIDSEDPDGLSGTDSAKIAQANKARFPYIKPLRDALENKYQWCIASVPGEAWAHKIFPSLPVDEAVEKLWDAILLTSRVDDNPIAAWEKHNKELYNHCKLLNDFRFDSLEYKSSNGTDFKVWLNPKGLFCGGGETTVGSKIYFNPNIPSEEVFTTPIRGRAEGKVVSTKPLSYQGKLIENFWIRFENGKVVEVHADKNQDLLEKMVTMDEGASYLGEVALIGYDSPINNTGILFYNTLFDENASCHLALGRGFNNCLENFENYTAEECNKLGVNDSMIHVDFMIGSKDLSIVGTMKDGKKVQVFKNGNWAI